MQAVIARISPKRLASLTIENSNRLIAWVRVLGALRAALEVAA